MHSATTNSATNSVANSWKGFFPTIELPESQSRIWATLHTPQVIDSALAQTAVKYHKLDGQMDLNFVTKFASAIMNRLDREAVSKAPIRAVIAAEKEEANGNIGNR